MEEANRTHASEQPQPPSQTPGSQQNRLHPWLQKVYNWTTVNHAIIILLLAVVVVAELIWSVVTIRNASQRVARINHALQSVSPTPEATPKQATAALSVVFDDMLATVDKDITATINVNTGNKDTDGTTAVIKYDPKVLSYVRVENGKLYKDYIKPLVDEKAGTIRISAITDLKTYYNGSGTFAKVIFTPKVKGNTSVTFVTAKDTTQSTIQSKGQDVLGESNTFELTVR